MTSGSEIATRKPTYQSIFLESSSYQKEERSVGQVGSLVLRCAVDVFIIRSSTPRLVVAGETLDAVRSVKTQLRGGQLTIDQDGACISIVNGRVFASKGGIAARGDVIINGNRVSAGGASFASARVAVALAMPRAPDVVIQGSGDVTIVEVDQEDLSISIQGSGDVSAAGRAGRLDVTIAGSGDVDAERLACSAASLSVMGSGDIEACVTQSVHATVMGSGDITVRGNPPERSQNLLGSGDIWFR